MKGEPGFSGRAGVPGRDGLPGLQGREGQPGLSGYPGQKVQSYFTVDLCSSCFISVGFNLN